MPISNKSPIPNSPKLLRGLLASGVSALVVSGVYEYLALAGVVDSMNAARIVLALAWLVGTVGILVSESVWGKSTKSKIVYSSIGAIALGTLCFTLDHWTVVYREKHLAQSNPINLPAANPHTSVLVQPGGKWHSNGDTVVNPEGTAIENRGEIDSKNLRVNPRGPRTLSEQLDTLLAVSADLRPREIPSWEGKAVEILSANFDSQTVKDFSSQPNLQKKIAYIKLLRRRLEP